MSYPAFIKLCELLPYGSSIHISKSDRGSFLNVGNNPAKEDSLRSINGLVVQAGFVRGNTHGYDGLAADVELLIQKISSSIHKNPFALTANWI